MRRKLAPRQEPTARQIAVLVALVETGNVKVAAHDLGMSYRTANNHIVELYRRLRVRNRVQAVRKLWSTIDPLVGPIGKPGFGRRAEDRRRS